MAATKRNFRKKSKSLRRKAKKSLRRKGSKKTRNTRSRGRTTRGGAKGDITMVVKDNAPLAAKTSVPPEVSQLIKVSFAATRSAPPRVLINGTGEEEYIMPTDAYTYAAQGSRASINIMTKHADYNIIDMETGNETNAKFAGYTQTDLYFYQ
jgi:hypothetical protein